MLLTLPNLASKFLSVKDFQQMEDCTVRHAIAMAAAASRRPLWVRWSIQQLFFFWFISIASKEATNDPKSSRNSPQFMQGV